MRWKIQVKNYRCFSDTNPLFIDLSNPVTALLGPNNSGKTAALRFFWEMGQTISQAPNSMLGSNNGSETRAFIPSKFRPLSDVYAVFTELNDRPMEIDLWQITTEFPLELFPDIMSENVRAVHIRVKIDRINHQAEVFLIHNGRPIIVSNDEFEFHFQSAGYLLIHKIERDQYFLDHSNTLYGLDQPTFVPAVRPFGNMHLKEKHELALGVDIISFWESHKLADYSGNRKYAAKLETEIARIFGYNQIDITPNQKKDDLIIKINNEKSYLMNDMGNGISHFITLLSNIPNRGNPLILFDEPEIGIHASLQVELMSLLAKYANGPIVFATHSIGLARSVADEILSFSMVNGVSKSIPFKNSPSHLETLGEMSFSAWREMGCDGVLFIEGASDIKVFSEWLSKLGLQKKWAILSLGGSETIHAAGVEAIKQVLAIHPKVAVVIDSELNEKEAKLESKRKVFKEACEAASIPCLITELRATENYFTQNAIKEALGNDFKALGPYEKLASKKWGKRDGLKISAKMTKPEIEETDVGKFLLDISR